MMPTDRVGVLQSSAAVSLSVICRVRATHRRQQAGAFHAPYASTLILLVAIGLGTSSASAGTPTAAEPARPAAETIGPQVQAQVEADWIEQDRQFAARKAPVAKEPSPAPAAAVTTQQDAAGGCDGIKTGRWGFHTASGEQDPWWQVDLGGLHRLDRVVIYNRCDTKRSPKFRILVADDPKAGAFRPVYEHAGTPFGGVEGKPLVVDLKGKDVRARVVRVFVQGRCSFALDEIEVYAVDDPQKNIALGKPADQKSVGRYSYAPATKKAVAAVMLKSPGGVPSTAQFHQAHAGTTGPGVQPSAATFPPAHIREVVARGQKLLARLGPVADRRRLGPLGEELGRVSRRLEEMEKAGEATPDARRGLYFDARRVVRAIAWCNPLLEIPSLLFVKRHDAVGVYHMCDQFYGCNAKPGGGLFVLQDPFGANPRLIDLLAESVVQQGRLAGQKLAGGSFLSPDVSFDGRTILFAYTQAKAYEVTGGKGGYLWSPEYSYHIFKVNADGTGLVQLTDGEADDFDPCWLPNGRIAFISERRGGYLRCGRHCPTYTLFGMAADGSDIICLSFHETHEWQPSVSNEGMLIYTRWDYVDRDTNVAHHMWTCFPDGRDPRSFHGNYPLLRESRPWMEMDIRAIPGSHRFVATTGAHHGHAFGSLVLIDPRLPDDRATSQLTRLTPEVPFPESEGGKGTIRQHMVYGTPWPLSEDDYLCAYDPKANNHGLYWIDRFGNKELIYRDPEIAAISPMPLGPRPRPPILPDRTTQTLASRAAGGADVPATIAVMNVYESDFEWPKGTKITALRIIQALPKSTAPPNKPRIGVASMTNARVVLGTVPVEADGSAYFEAPVGKAIYFQALDERGMAVQSMRSATYVHPGEQLSCQGCHEGKHQPPASGAAIPLALRRGPSPVPPDGDGSAPFNYVRLVQPVLDRNCVECHRQKKALDLTGVIEGKDGFSRSYTNLAKNYGFYYHVGNGSIKDPVHGGSRTVAGQFGARAAKLLGYLDEKHHGVKLSPEDFHRLVLWLDCTSEFYGSYENTEAQARGEIVLPTLE